MKLVSAVASLLMSVICFVYGLSVYPDLHATELIALSMLLSNSAVILYKQK